MLNKNFYQAILFGVVTVLIGLLLSWILQSLKPELAKECEEWDKYYVMEISLFLTGFILRLLIGTEWGRQYLINYN